MMGRGFGFSVKMFSKFIDLQINHILISEVSTVVETRSGHLPAFGPVVKSVGNHENCIENC